MILPSRLHIASIMLCKRYIESAKNVLVVNTESRKKVRKNIALWRKKTCAAMCVRLRFFPTLIASNIRSALSHTHSPSLAHLFSILIFVLFCFSFLSLRLSHSLFLLCFTNYSELFEIREGKKNKSKHKSTIKTGNRCCWLAGWLVCCLPQFALLL